MIMSANEMEPEFDEGALARKSRFVLASNRKDHLAEVEAKWSTLKMNDDIWAKLIYFERNRRLAKAYVSAPVLSIDGSTMGLDGFRIGLSGIENRHRTLDSMACLRSIGRGIRLRIDSQGNILMRRNEQMMVGMDMAGSGQPVVNQADLVEGAGGHSRINPGSNKNTTIDKSSLINQQQLQHHSQPQTGLVYLKSWPIFDRPDHANLNQRTSTDKNLNLSSNNSNSNGNGNSKSNQSQQQDQKFKGNNNNNNNKSSSSSSLIADELQVNQEKLLPGQALKLFDMRKFRSKLELDLELKQQRQRRNQQRHSSQDETGYASGNASSRRKSAAAAAAENESNDLRAVTQMDWRQCVSMISFVQPPGDARQEGPAGRGILQDSCWLMIINIIAMDMLKSANSGHFLPLAPLTDAGRLLLAGSRSTVAREIHDKHLDEPEDDADHDYHDLNFDVDEDVDENNHGYPARGPLAGDAFWLPLDRKLEHRQPRASRHELTNGARVRASSSMGRNQAPSMQHQLHQQNQHRLQYPIPVSERALSSNWKWSQQHLATHLAGPYESSSQQTGTRRAPIGRTNQTIYTTFQNQNRYLRGPFSYHYPEDIPARVTTTTSPRQLAKGAHTQSRPQHQVPTHQGAKRSLSSLNLAATSYDLAQGSSDRKARQSLAGNGLTSGRLLTSSAIRMNFAGQPPVVGSIGEESFGSQSAGSSSSFTRDDGHLMNSSSDSCYQKAGSKDVASSGDLATRKESGQPSEAGQSTVAKLAKKMSGASLNSSAGSTSPSSGCVESCEYFLPSLSPKSKHDSQADTNKKLVDWMQQSTDSAGLFSAGSGCSSFDSSGCSSPSSNNNHKNRHGTDKINYSTEQLANLSTRRGAKLSKSSPLSSSDSSLNLTNHHHQHQYDLRGPEVGEAEVCCRPAVSEKRVECFVCDKLAPTPLIDMMIRSKLKPARKSSKLDYPLSISDCDLCRKLITSSDPSRQLDKPLRVQLESNSKTSTKKSSRLACCEAAAAEPDRKERNFETNTEDFDDLISIDGLVLDDSNDDDDDEAALKTTAHGPTGDRKELAGKKGPNRLVDKQVGANRLGATSSGPLRWSERRRKYTRALSRFINPFQNHAAGQQHRQSEDQMMTETEGPACKTLLCNSDYEIYDCRGNHNHSNELAYCGQHPVSSVCRSVTCRTQSSSKNNLISGTTYGKCYQSSSGSNPNSSSSASSTSSSGCGGAGGSHSNSSVNPGNNNNLSKTGPNLDRHQHQHHKPQRRSDNGGEFVASTRMPNGKCDHSINQDRLSQLKQTGYGSKLSSSSSSSSSTSSSSSSTSTGQATGLGKDTTKSEKQQVQVQRVSRVACRKAAPLVGH